MKTIPFLATLGLILTFTGPAFGDAIDELNMGLSKTSVFDTPTPAAYYYSDAKPGRNDSLPRAWEDAPPQIPHRVDEFLPVMPTIISAWTAMMCRNILTSPKTWTGL